MPEFISKVQHDNYEKGEFSDEKARTLEETLELIKTFPWDKERDLTDIKLTGPSITIQDEHVNYLKVGIYFGGKYCVYYLDNDNNLYEQYITNIDDVFTLVTNFFNNQLDLKKFNKNLFSFRSESHFLTRHFEYRIKLWRVLMLTSTFLFFSIMFLIMDIAIVVKPTHGLVRLIIIPISFYFFYILFKLFRYSINNRNNYLKISKGNDIFKFGYTKNEIYTLNKKDIKRIVFYDYRGKRNLNSVHAYEIIFKDDSSIIFSNILISFFELDSKFSDKLDNFNLPFRSDKTSPLDIL